jgi:uncharacterized protein (AIM24 family)
VQVSKKKSDDLLLYRSTVVVETAAIIMNTPLMASDMYSNQPVVTGSETHHIDGLPILAGYEQWVPPQPPKYKDHLPIYEIIGTDAQIVQFPVRPGRAIMCFSGAMAYMSEGITTSVKLAGLGKTFGRLAGGGSLFEVTYTNESDKTGFVACTPDYPGVIVPINMKDCPSGQIIALRDSFLCATYGLGDATTDVGAGFNPANSVAGFCCSGVDFIVQTLSNGEWAFLMAMGTVVQKVRRTSWKLCDATVDFCCSITIIVTFS